MARYVDAIDLQLPLEEAFDYLADFSHTAEWDPGVVEAECLTEGPIGTGSRFRVVVSFLGQRSEFEYEITVYERPRRLVLRGTNASVLSLDELTFVPRDGGTRVTYEARLELAGLRRLADPLLQGLFQWIGRRAVRGLRERAVRLHRSRARRRRRSRPAAPDPTPDSRVDAPPGVDSGSVQAPTAHQTSA